MFRFFLCGDFAENGQNVVVFCGNDVVFGVVNVVRRMAACGGEDSVICGNLRAG
jgi:hypothetical protein